ncbi:hypothetical protein Nepgr_028786 [Nepenthes gracilis]|uniref:Uncharacterized protein n=1 Tax=Nepenthes gracilis TaxID=150966 RepID=A0AAD3TBD6_NEPGR|nr:hypothetical protein Nepgr_028786 [Nepenthes gracilis]
MQLSRWLRDDLEEALASCSFDAVVGLVTAVNEKDHSNTLIGCAQVVVDLEQPHEASGLAPDLVVNDQLSFTQEANELLNSIPSHADCPGHAPNLIVNNQPTSIGDPGSAPRQPSTIEDIHKEWHHVPYAEVLRSGIIAAGAGIPSAGAAPQQEISKVVPYPASDAAFPISGSLKAADETGGTIGLDVNVDSHALSSTPRLGSPSLDPQGGDPRSDNSISSLRRNILEFRKYLIGPATHRTEVFYDGHDTPYDFRLKPILKKPKKPKRNVLLPLILMDRVACFGFVGQNLLIEVTLQLAEVILP